MEVDVKINVESPIDVKSVPIPDDKLTRDEIIDYVSDVVKEVVEAKTSVNFEVL